MVDLLTEAMGATGDFVEDAALHPSAPVCIHCGHRPDSFKWRAFEVKGLCKHELEAVAVEPKAKTLSEMNKTELLEVAEAEGIALADGATVKAIADAIREARKAKG